MLKTGVLSALFLTLVCSAVAQSADSIPQKRETFVLEKTKSRKDKSADDPQKSSKIIVAINNFSKKPTEEHRNRLLWNDGHWAGFGIHYSGLITNLSDMTLPADAEYLSQSAKSIGVTLNPIDYTLLKSRHVGLVTGLGVEFNNFRFDNNITLKQENGVTLPDYQYENQNIKLSKSKLYTCYLNVPLLVEFQMGRHNNFFINVGVVGGWRIGTHTKIKASDPRLNGKFKDNGNFNLRNFHYGYTLNFGYNHFAISATYYRSTLFKDQKGPRVQQINVGLALIL